MTASNNNHKNNENINGSDNSCSLTCNNNGLKPLYLEHQKPNLLDIMTSSRTLIHCLHDGIIQSTKGGCRRPIEAFPRKGHVTTCISLERSHRVEQLCPLGQSDPQTTGSARRRQSMKFFSQFFLI